VVTDAPPQGVSVSDADALADLIAEAAGAAAEKAVELATAPLLARIAELEGASVLGAASDEGRKGTDGAAQQAWEAMTELALERPLEAFEEQVAEVRGRGSASKSRAFWELINLHYANVVHRRVMKSLNARITALEDALTSPRTTT
jgi:ribosomal protein S8E